MLLPLPPNVSKASILHLPAFLLEHSKVLQHFITPHAHSQSCHANEPCVATLIFLKQVTKLNSPLMWENLESNSWAVMAGWFWIVHMMTQALILLAGPSQHPFPPKCWKKYGHLRFHNAFSYLQHMVLTKHLISWGVQNAEIITCLTSIILRSQFLSLQQGSYLDWKKMKDTMIKRLNWQDT